MPGPNTIFQINIAYTFSNELKLIETQTKTIILVFAPQNSSKTTWCEQKSEHFHNVNRPSNSDTIASIEHRIPHKGFALQMEKIGKEFEYLQLQNSPQIHTNSSHDITDMLDK